MTGPYSIEGGEVRFTEPSGHVVTSFPDTQMLAVAFDEVAGSLHKHGREVLVAKWADDTRQKFLSTGFGELAKEIVVVSFPATPETIREINACIAISGRVKTIVETLGRIANRSAGIAP